MITSKQAKKFKEYLSNDYTTDVLKKLKAEKITKPNGEEYSAGYITHVFNGRKSNIKIENAIFKIYTERRNEAEKLKQEIKQSLSA